MSSEPTQPRDPLTRRIVLGFAVVIAAFVAAAIVWCWRLQVMAGVLQVLGIVLVALGLDVVRASLQRAADTAKHGVARWLAIRRKQLGRWWLRRCGYVHDIADAHVATAKGISPEDVRVPVDRDTISDRAWLEHLDNQVADLFSHVTRADESRTADANKLDRRFAADHDDLQAEIIRVSRAGWELFRRPRLLRGGHRHRDLELSGDLQAIGVPDIEGGDLLARALVKVKAAALPSLQEAGR